MEDDSYSFSLLYLNDFLSINKDTSVNGDIGNNNFGVGRFKNEKCTWGE